MTWIRHFSLKAFNGITRLLLTLFDILRFHLTLCATLSAINKNERRIQVVHGVLNPPEEPADLTAHCAGLLVARTKESAGNTESSHSTQ